MVVPPHVPLEFSDGELQNLTSMGGKRRGVYTPVVLYASELEQHARRTCSEQVRTMTRHSMTKSTSRSGRSPEQPTLVLI